MTFGHGRLLLLVTMAESNKVVYCIYPNDNTLSTCTGSVQNRNISFAVFGSRKHTKHNNTHKCRSPAHFCTLYNYIRNA
jgi:hypothetical protein